MTKHCAKFTDALLPRALSMLSRYYPWEPGAIDRNACLLDPFAGTGKGVDFMAANGFFARGVELEPEWAAQSERVDVGSALELSWARNQFDVIFTSPCYGNRMADKDMRASVAGTYAKSLGRHASDGSSCHLQWGPTYRSFHENAWVEADRVLRPGGLFLLNIKDHYRGQELAGVPQWHRSTLKRLGYTWLRTSKVATPSLRNGTNSESRVDHELLVLMQKP